jgi:hypothetical protein
MATSEGCCHLTGAMLNLAAEAADRAQIAYYICKLKIAFHSVVIVLYKFQITFLLIVFLIGGLHVAQRILLSRKTCVLNKTLSQ